MRLCSAPRTPRGFTAYVAFCAAGGRLNARLAGDRGFEPRLADSESAVLPLDESPSLADYSILHGDEQGRCYVGVAGYWRC